MKFGLTVIGAVLLAAGVTFGQMDATDMAGLERRMHEAQLALAGAQPTSLERELRDLQDELAYLRVKARRGETVTARDRRDLADKLDRYTARLHAGRPYDSSSRDNRDRITNEPIGARAIPSGTEMDVRLQSRLSSRDAMVEDRVEATTMVDLYHGEDLLVPAGSLMVGDVTAVDKATRTDRRGSVTVAFRRLTANGRTHDIRASVTQALESDGLKGEAGRIGAGAGVGAIIGGILGGVKGAIAGILIGGGGVLVATEGKDVDLPAGTVLRVRFDSHVPMNE
jgi:hypothetical protein